MTFQPLVRPFALLFGLATARLAVAGITSDPATGTPGDFFGLDKVYTFHLTISAADYQKMQPPSGRSMARPGVTGDDRYPAAQATLEFEGRKWGDISLRYKGNSSYNSAGSLKRPLKLEFGSSGDAKEKARTFFGLSKLNLNNNAMDSSQMREALGYEVFRYEGVPAPRTAFAKLYLTVPGTYDRQYAGLYTVEEQVDQTFLKDRLGKKTGPLVKPEGLRGMPYLGENFDSYLIPYGVKTADKVDPEDAKRFIAFVKFLNQASDDEFARKADAYVDVDAFLRLLAVEVMTVNLDSPLGMGHNYYVTLDPKTKKVIWIPWDLNLAFGSFGGRGGGRGAGGGGATTLQDLSVNQPSPAGQWPLADRLLAIPRYLEQYDAIVRALATKNFTVQRLGNEIELMSKAIREAVAMDAAVTMTQFERNLSANPGPTPVADAQSGLGPGGFGGFGGGRGRGGGPGGRGGGPPLRQFVELRVESVLEQLDGKREGYTPSGRGGGGPRGGPGGGGFGGGFGGGPGRGGFGN